MKRMLIITFIQDSKTPHNIILMNNNLILKSNTMRFFLKKNNKIMMSINKQRKKCNNRVIRILRVNLIHSFSILMI
jgi:hypothetical protein